MNTSNVRLATLDQIMADIVPNFLAPVPTRRWVKDLFDRENISRDRPKQRRGGGIPRYDVAQVLALFKRRFTPHATTSMRRSMAKIQIANQQVVA